MENANCFAADHGVTAFIRNIVQGCFIFALFLHACGRLRRKVVVEGY